MVSLLLFLFLLITSNASHEEIFSWWNDLSVQKPIKCNMNKEYLRKPNKSSIFEKMPLSEPCVLTRPCEENDNINYDFTFNGRKMKTILEGLGKLKILSSQKFSDDEEESKIQRSKKICLVDNTNIIEAVGTFLNGTLNGPGKVKFQDGSSIIAEFKSGVPFGMVRKWSADKTFTSLAYVENDLKISKNRQWRRQEDGNYLIWTEEFSTFNSGSAEEFLTLFIPFDSANEVLIGQFDPMMKLVKDLYSVDVQIKSEMNSCFMDLMWTKIEKKTYDFILSNGNMVKIEALDNNACQNIGNKGRLAEQFKEWHDQFVLPMHFRKTDVITKMLRFLRGANNMPFSFEKINKLKVSKPFLSLKHIYFEDNIMKANISHWKGETLPWIVNKFGFDAEGQIHGVCQFELVPEYYNKTGTNDFFHWSINGFSGRFLHGLLEGIVQMTTWQGNVLMATFRNGEMHGPAISYGRTPVYDIWVIR